MTQVNISMKQEQNRRQREQTCGYQGAVYWGNSGAGDWDYRCKFLYTEWINHKVLMHSTENYIQLPMINHNGKKYKKECIYIYIHMYM